jgi:hypothetical protein
MTWRLFFWMSLPWLALAPGAWHWIPGGDALATAALRALLVAAPFCLGAREGAVDRGTLVGACAIASAGLCAALVIEGASIRMPVQVALLVAWAFAVRWTGDARRGDLRDRARVLAAVWLGAPLAFLLAPGDAAAFARWSPWRAASADSWPDAVPALAACAALWLWFAWERGRRAAAVAS